MQNAQQVLVIINILLWFGALVSYIFSTKAHPKAHRRERFWYSSILGSYIIHTILFFVVTLLPNHLSFRTLSLWSAIVYMHGALALIIKEVLVVLRARMQK